ncbi:chaperonin-containing tcp1 subunit 8 (theta) [Anaeramoeba flamelloides]|uniref:CCT-theta n=1 Tax=Anaeramoeba flamelloides TaxID=1746091 RepID=A0AAV7ZK75_9EUKA|nr:chaperonin-containing tcp1 subunit 8 (theta) [Anaeramoeba flamelloides]
MNRQRSLARSGNIENLLKSGTKYLSSLEETIIQNIDACIDLAELLTTSLGPNGMNKMIINRLSKLIITNDSSTILKELEVVHPAATMILEAAQMQEKEIGDGTNFVIVFAGEILKQAQSLILSGIHPVEIIDGYNKAGKEALKYMDELVVKTVEDVRNEEDVAFAVSASIASKQFGYEDFLSTLVAKACIAICPNNEKNFVVDNIRVVKIIGGSVYDSKIIKGFVTNRTPKGSIRKIENAKVVCYTGGVEASNTETGSNVLIESAKELKNYTKGEEDLMEKKIKKLAEMGINVVVSGHNISEIAAHFLEKYGILALKLPSKFEMLRVCRTVRAMPLSTFIIPSEKEIGTCGSVRVELIGGTKITIFEQSKKNKSKLATIIVRAATKNVADDIERAIDDGVNSYRALCKDGRLLAGGGAFEIEMSRHIQKFGEKSPGMDQYAIKKFAEGLEVVPRNLALNAGMRATELISNLYSSHEEGKKNSGVDVINEGICDMVKKNVFDLYQTRYWSMRLALNVAITILRVDQIIMSKRAQSGIAPPPQVSRDVD